MTAKQVLNRITLIAGETITAGRIVALDGTHTVNKGVGVAERAAETGEAIPVITQGICHVTSGGVISAGNFVTADSAGKAVAIAPLSVAAGSNVEVVGIAIDAAGGADVTIRIYVMPHSAQGVLDTDTSLYSIVATENLTANHIADAAGAHTANAAMGVVVASVLSGEAASLKRFGTASVVSGAAFAIGDWLTADSAGKAIKFDPTNINLGVVVGIIGVALQQATDADQTKTILVSPCVSVGTKATG